MIENGIDSLEFEGMGKKDLTELFKIVSAYRSVLKELEKRFHVIEVVQYLIENPDIIALKGKELFAEIEKYIKSLNYNILNKNITDEIVHLYIQTNDGLEEIKIDDDLFSSPLFTEAVYINSKIHERDVELPNSELLNMLDEVEKNAKKGAYIQRYKGLGEMNPEQLWETTMDPGNRRLLKIKIEDAEIASDTFSLFMGDEVEPRREYIQTHAKDVKHLDV